MSSEDLTRAQRSRAYLRELFSYRWILKNLVFFLFVAFLTVLYIANGHEADKVTRDINVASRQIRDLKYQYKTLKSEEIFRSREAQIVQAASALGLRLSAQPPMHITMQVEHTENGKP